MDPTAEPVLRAVIHGSDVLLAARPATPVQLARASLRFGFDFVAPVSWGEELLAERTRTVAEHRAGAPTIPAHCPFVAESLRLIARTNGACLTGVAPPVATARYVRAALAPHAVHVTYVGRCPGATMPDLDESILPEVFLARLLDAGVDPADQPLHYEGRLPPERARHASLPGGIPAPEWLIAPDGIAVREAAPATLDAVVGACGGAALVVDLEVATGCVCARDRFALALLEPPRTSVPVVDLSLAVSLADGAAAGVAASTGREWLLRSELETTVEVGAPPEPGAMTVDATADRSPRGNAAVPDRDAGHVPPVAAPIPRAGREQAPWRLTMAVEPWMPASRPDGRAAVPASGGATPVAAARSTDAGAPHRRPAEIAARPVPGPVAADRPPVPTPAPPVAVAPSRQQSADEAARP
jgi:hypothetical protein